jgi:hypothetical protein
MARPGNAMQAKADSAKGESFLFKQVIHDLLPEQRLYVPDAPTRA